MIYALLYKCTRVRFFHSKYYVFHNLYAQYDKVQAWFYAKIQFFHPNCYQNEYKLNIFTIFKGYTVKKCKTNV